MFLVGVTRAGASASRERMLPKESQLQVEGCHSCAKSTLLDTVNKRSCHACHRGKVALLDASNGGRRDKGPTLSRQSANSGREPRKPSQERTTFESQTCTLFSVIWPWRGGCCLTSPTIPLSLSTPALFWFNNNF